ncbi:hypothetical protein Tco_0370022 [Tanacetum coccineum]
MEPKDTLSSCLDSDEQDMQQMLKRTKILKGSCLNGLSVLESNFTRKHVQGITKSEFERAFSHIFGEDVDTFTRTFSQNMDILEQQLTKETILESNCQNAFRVLNTQFEKIFTSVLIKPSSLDEYTQLEILEFCDTLIQHMESVKKSIYKKALHKREYDSWVNERHMQTTEEKIDTSNALDASLADTERSGTLSKVQDTSSRSGNDAHADDADIRPIYDEEPMAEVQTTAEINVFATGQQHTEQPEFNNEGEVDQNVEQCHDTCPLPAKLTVFLRMKALLNLELKYQNQALKEGQHGQFSKVKSNEAKIKHDIDVTETINIELEHKVAKLLKENETLKRNYKELSDSIKTARAKTIEPTTSLIAQNAEFKS